MFLANTGPGKGKSTAGFGQVVRTAGAGEQVLFVQFMKSWESSELVILRSIPNIEVINSEDKPRDFTWGLDETGKAALKESVQESLRKAREFIENNEVYLMVMDEVGYSIHEEYMTADDVLFFKDKVKHLYITGHFLPDVILKQLDYHTEMVPHKHPYYDRDILAEKGLDY